MSEEHNYRLRYRVDPWGKPLEGIPKQIIPGITVMSNNGNWGYTDDLLMVSVVRLEDGSIESLLLLTSEEAARDALHPTPELLKEVRDYIDHWLERHT